MDLSGKAVAVPDIDAAMIRALFSLYATYYAPTDETAFRRDLARKSYCIILSDGAGRVCGFSTVARRDLMTTVGAVTVLFSGDTVIDRAHWGEQTLPFTWIEAAGRIKADRPHLPLYWLLITKGHRTYRYLPAFAQVFHPQNGGDPALCILAGDIAAQMFGDRFDPDRGVLRPDPDCPTALRPEFAGLDPGRQARLQVQAFLARNPGHARGEELVCLCELSVANLRLRARRHFLKGMG